MSPSPLNLLARRLAADDKGLLAIDESTPTCDRRFAPLGIAQTAENRRRWRELIITTPRLAESISGLILYDETIRQTDAAGRRFPELIASAGMLVGIKVDTGTSDLAGRPGETITEGLDGLRARLATYAAMGASFAKWRGVVSIGDGRPSRGCIEANAHALARYAALCQEAGLVPIVEPEVLMAGSHTLAQCASATEALLRAVFAHACEQGVALEGMVLKPAMVLPGADCPVQDETAAIAEATVACLRRAVPAAVPVIAFLSGGQAAELASARLAAMQGPALPWALTYSFARAIQQPALELWRGDDANRVIAQNALLHRAACNRAARRGEYGPALESEPA